MTTPREYLSQLNSSVIRLGLVPVARLLRSLNNPQDAYASVLIGGTNGKGSIAATLDSILRQAGYRVGLYTSPHLVDLRERIRVNGAMIPEETFDSLIDAVRGKVEEEITYFEFLTAVAFLHFCRMEVDVAVLEVGMGGRLDATNGVSPLVSVISNISLEHSEYLGKRLKDIAWEKGGIVKEGGVCITAAKQKPVIDVIEKICRERNAKLYRLGRDIRLRRRGDGTFTYHGINNKFARLTCCLKGRYQLENAAMALAAVEILAKNGFPVGSDAVYRGMEKTQWEGRLELLQTSPRLLVDGGHNPAGVSVLCRALKENFSYQRMILIFAVMGDKNYSLMLKKLASLADVIIITKPKTARALPLEKLMLVTENYGKPVEAVEQVEDALQRALALAGKDDLICAAGSLYLVGEIKAAYANMDMRRQG